MQNICNLIGRNSIMLLIFLISTVQISIECETHEDYSGNTIQFNLH